MDQIIKNKILINIEMMNVNLISIGIMITFFFCRALLAFGWIYLMHAFTQPVVDSRRQTIRALMMMMINCQQYINGRQNRNRERERDSCILLVNESWGLVGDQFSMTTKKKPDSMVRINESDEYICFEATMQFYLLYDYEKHISFFLSFFFNQGQIEFL